MGTGLALFCQNDEGMHQIFCLELEDTKLSKGCANGAKYIQKILETWLRRAVIAQAMSWQSAFEMHLYFSAVMFWKSVRERSWCPLCATIIDA